LTAPGKSSLRSALSCHKFADSISVVPRGPSMSLKSVASIVLRKPYHFLKHRIALTAYNRAQLRAAKTKLLNSDALRGNEKALVGKVSCRVHFNDGMYLISPPDEYLAAGISAVRCIEHVLAQSAGHRDVRTILDFACGYGRVLRFLKPRFPVAGITASDINPEALDFCRSAFSVKTVSSNVDFTRLLVAGRFDLIWCGSLITHIDENAAARLLRFFHDHLSPGGVCIFTTHGNRAAEKMPKYGLSETAQRQVLSQFRTTGYGYADYPGQRGNGISLVSHKCMAAIARTAGEWNQTAFLDHGWHNLQDVYGFAYLAPSPIRKSRVTNSLLDS
jgi:SAM-dependent methyltransferase